MASRKGGGSRDLTNGHSGSGVSRKKRLREDAFPDHGDGGDRSGSVSDDINDTSREIWSNTNEPARERGHHVHSRSPTADHEGDDNVLVIHRVSCSTSVTSSEDHSKHDTVAHYRDIPRLFRTDTRGHALRGLVKVLDMDEFLERHDRHAFVVYRDYNCEEYHASVRDEFKKQAPDTMSYELFIQFRPWFYSLSRDMEPPRHNEESVHVFAPALEKVLDDVVTGNTDTLSPWNEPHNLRAPYDYFLHHQSEIGSWCETSESPHVGLLKTLLHYVQSNYGSEHDDAEERFQSGSVTEDTFSKLFRPKEIVVTRKAGEIQAYQIERLKSIQRTEIELQCSYWTFDGTFKARSKDIWVSWPPGAPQVAITSLEVHPLRLDTTGLEQRLERRGHVFWSCRRKKLMSYTPRDASSFELHTTNPKYMIDLETHRYLHPELYEGSENLTDEFDEVSAHESDPPDDPLFMLLLPPTILGYGFHDKKWRTLQVEHLCEVSWNTKAFNRLVLKSHKKELIQAVVTSHIEKNEATDLVDDKGNGLIMLLHGPPGTGKTLTAESIAEVAQKPLYRITCGDIGTAAQQVEEYLESALYIGTVWGCVVLLDEADVFLEERTQTDLVRNALVSIFLRTLEYYDGILILTSNRVGLFDEAFKSRVQVAITYPKLDEKGRKEIWRNFFNALSVAHVEMEYEELQEKAPALAEFELNGRQIRNTIKTARQLAKFSKQRLAFSHLEKVVDVANEFEDYLNKTRGYTDEQWAHEQKLR